MGMLCNCLVGALPIRGCRKLKRGNIGGVPARVYMNLYVRLAAAVVGLCSPRVL